jgi:hypothetical protein
MITRHGWPAVRGPEPGPPADDRPENPDEDYEPV